MISSVNNIGPFAFLYGRKSDETGTRQELTEGVQFEACNMRLKQMNERRVFEGLPPLLDAGWFYDARSTGVDWFCREAAQEMFARLRRGDYIVMAKLDRAARNQKDWVNSFDRLKEIGAFISCVDPDIDFSSPFGEMYAQIIMAVAQNERSQIRARTKAALTQKRVNGLPYSNAAPVGWMKVGVKRDSRFKPDHEERALCNELLRMHDDGTPINDICRWLRSQGIVHKTSHYKHFNWKKLRASRSQPFGWCTVRAMIYAARLGFPLKSRKEIIAAYASDRGAQ